MTLLAFLVVRLFRSACVHGWVKKVKSTLNLGCIFFMGASPQTPVAHYARGISQEMPFSQ